MESTSHCAQCTYDGQIQFQPHCKFWGRSLILVTLRFLALFGVGMVGRYTDNCTCFSFQCPPWRFLYGECLKHSTTERQHLLIWGQLLSWCTLQCSSCTKHPGEITKKRPGNFKIGIRQTEMGIINFSELSHFFRRMKQQVSDDRTWTEQLKEAFFSGAHLWHAACAGHSYDLMLTPSTDQYYHFSVEITFQISKGAWGQEKIEINLLHSRLDVF